MDIVSVPPRPFAFRFMGVCLALMLSCAVSHAQSSGRNVLILDPEKKAEGLTSEITAEINALLSDVTGTSVRTIQVPAAATDADIEALIARVYADPQAQVIVVSDLGLNQAFARKGRYEKPTILPFVFDAAFNGLKEVNGTSGVANLTYTAPDFDLAEEFKTYANIAPIQNAVLISNQRIINRLSEETAANAIQAGKAAGFSLSVLGFDGDVQALITGLPEQTDAIFIGFLPYSDAGQVQALISALTQNGIATFSLSSERYVSYGALAANAPATDASRIARRAAIHVAEMLSGTKAETLPVTIDMVDQLIINMATARAIKVAPSFDVLSSAKLLNEITESVERVYSLTRVARDAVETNLTLMAQRFQAEEANARIAEARGQLLPQVTASASFLERRNTMNVSNGLSAKRSTDGTLELSQSIFTEEFWADYRIEKYAAYSERELLREVELDIIEAAVETYLSILREKTSFEQALFNLEITRENLRLASNRVSVGTEDASDLYRWQSELATARQEVLSARADFEQLRQELNQILNRPIDEPFGVTVETLQNPDLLITDSRITQLISNAYDLQILTNYFVELGLDRSPEIQQALASVDSNRRQLKSDKRQLWLPDFSLVGRYSNNFQEDRDTSLGGFPGEDDWSVSVEASIPLFEGGARFSRINQSRFAVRQSETSLRNIENQVEQDVRNAMESLTASFGSIPLAKEAEEAAQKNYELVASAYAQGQRDIINVLDAQESLVDAREAALNAVFNFLIDLMTTQRAIGGFDFFLDDSEKLQFTEELIRRVQLNQSRRQP